MFLPKEVSAHAQERGSIMVLQVKTPNELRRGREYGKKGGLEGICSMKMSLFIKKRLDESQTNLIKVFKGELKQSFIGSMFLSAPN